MSNHFYVSETISGGLISIGIVRRKIISVMQWISNFISFVIGIVALVDISLASPRRDYYVYYTYASAAAAGLPFQPSVIGWIPYAVLQSCVVGFVIVAAIMELRCYSIKMVGIDLKWDIYPFKFINIYTVKKSLKQAQDSFSPHGSCYDNYFYFAPLVNIVILGLLGVHITFGFDVMSFTPLFVTYSFCLFIILLVYMIKLFVFPKKEIERYRRLEELTNTIENLIESIEESRETT